VDAVSEVIDIANDKIEPPPQFGTSIQRDFIRGMGKVDGEFVVLIEPDRALSIEEMAMLAEREHAH
jgi:purine-binding chemotaxis protein CheW